MKVYNLKSIPKFDDDSNEDNVVRNTKKVNKSLSRLGSRAVKKSIVKNHKASVLSWILIIKFILKPFVYIVQIFNVIINVIDQILPRSGFIKSVTIISFLSIIVSFFNIFNNSATNSSTQKRLGYDIYPAKRGDIFIHNATSNKDISLTSSEIAYTIKINANYLKQNISKGFLNKDTVVTKLSSELNIPWNEVNDLINKEIAKPDPSQSVFLKKNATVDQGKTVQRLRASNDPMMFENWIEYQPVETRSYNILNESMGSITGFVQNYKFLKKDVPPSCYQMVVDNEARGTVDSYDRTNEKGEYKIGSYGIEGLFCSELGGLNGRQSTSVEMMRQDASNSKVQNGANIYLTLDYNLQVKAQEVLDAAIKTNVSKLTGKPPRDGLVIVMSLEKTAKTEPGEILAMASYPTADPNKYSQLDIDKFAGFVNTAVKPYESGSVMKTLTMAASYNEWFKESVNDKGERVGLDPNWLWTAYPRTGKEFPNGTKDPDRITNAQGAAYSDIDKKLRECLRWSINTCLADVEQRISNSVNDIQSGKKLKHTGIVEYFRDKLLIGKPKLVNFAANAPTNTSAFDREINVDFSAAAWGFGQGFTITPIELVRAYSAIARGDGSLIEPYIVRKIAYDNGESYSANDPKAPAKVYRGEPKKVFDPNVAKLIQEHMVYTLDQYGNAAVNAGKVAAVNGYVDGYPIAAKTGTAQVTTDEATKGLCNPGEDKNKCSLRVGIYDQTFIGFGPVGDKYKDQPKFLIMIKLAEPRVGEPNYFGIDGLGQYFSQMFAYTLGYYGVPADPSLIK